MRIYIIITLIFFLSHFAYGSGFYHKVKWGDTLYSIGKRYGISHKRLLLLNPNLKRNNIKAGAKLRIASSNIGLHKVAKGETLWSIARRYSLSISEIRRLNRLSNEGNILFAGQDIIVSRAAHMPGQSFNSIPRKELFFWPANGKILKSYGRYDHLFNPGIRLKTGNNIKSSLKGKVTFVGKIRGYGNTIVISHINGFLTMYSSNDMEVLVSPGKFVKSREIIAVKKAVKRDRELTFNFYLSSNNVFVNPINYLKDMPKHF